MYLPNTTWTWSFMGIALAQALVNLALQSYVFAKFQTSLNDNARGANAPSDALTIPTYLALFLFGFLYELVLVWDALRLKNTIQVIGVCFYNLGMVVYSAVEIEQVRDAIEGKNALEDEQDIEIGTWPTLRPYLLAAPLTITLGTILLSFVAWKLYDEFAWSIYKHISADLRLKRRYLTYQIYIALLKFDFFFFLGFCVQFLVVVRRATSDAEFGLTIAAVPITVVLLLLAAYFTRRESYLGQCAVIVVYFAALAYFVFKLVRMYHGEKVVYYRPARNSLTTFAILTLLLLLVTIAVAFVCMRNFNKGLKPHIQRSTGSRTDELDIGKFSGYETYSGSQHPLDAVPPRMTID